MNQSRVSSVTLVRSKAIKVHMTIYLCHNVDPYIVARACDPDQNDYLSRAS